jgi:transglutaminase-like putative cysteine protease
MTQAVRLTGPRLWLATSVLVVAVVAGLRTLGTLVLTGPWVTTATVGVLLLALLVGVLRQTLRSRLAPTAWGLLGVVIGVAGQYGGLTTGFSIPRPTEETAERLRLLVAQGRQTIVEGRIPVQPTRGLELLVVGGVLATYLVAELVALGLGRGGLAGVPLLALWSPAVSFERDVGLPLLLVGGTTYVLLLALTRRRSRRQDLTWRRETVVAVVAAGLVTVVAVGAGTAAGALPFAGSVRLPSAWGVGGIDSPLRLSTDLDMRSDLDGRSDRPLLSYTGDVQAVGALRMYTVARFDGQEWHRGDLARDLVPADGVLWPTAVPEAEEPERVRVDVLALDADRLPIPGEPRAVDVAGRWLYDPAADEVVGTDLSTRGLSYDLEIVPRGLSPDVLRDDRPGRPGPEPLVHLAVPATSHEADIRALAAEVTADAETAYDQAVALQSWLRSAQNFAYDTRLDPPQTDDAVWDFLTSRRGYCVQFATAMTVMARMLGIPARMAVGFLPGEPDGDRRDRFVVTARQAHTWPELYFEDAGWVRFEPTPARQTGAPPVYADPFAGQPQVPENIPTGAAVPGGVPTGGPGAPTQRPREVVSIGEAEIPVTTFAAGLAGVLLVALVLAVLAWRRRRRLASVPRGPEEWWARLRADLAAHGVRWTDATTPRQAAALVHGRLRADGTQDVTALLEARRALDALVAAVEADRYAPRPADATAEELGSWVAAVERPLVAVGARPDED